MRMRLACPGAPKDQVNPVVQVGGDKGPLQGSAVAAQEVVWAVSPGRQLHIANCRPVLPRAQRQRLPVDQEAVGAQPSQQQHTGKVKAMVPASAKHCTCYCEPTCTAAQSKIMPLPGIEQEKLRDEFLDICGACGGALPRLAHAAEQAIRRIKPASLQPAGTGKQLKHTWSLHQPQKTRLHDEAPRYLTTPILHDRRMRYVLLALPIAGQVLAVKRTAAGAQERREPSRT